MSPRTLAGAALAGLLAGVLTQLGQGVLPGASLAVANSITPWLAVAFAVGAAVRRPRAAAVAGAVALLGALVGYFGLVWLRFEYGPALGGANLVWLAGAIVGGPVFGVAGAWWCGDHRWRRATGPALLGAAAIAEGGYLSRVETVAAAAPWFVVAGILVPVVLGRTNGDRARGLVALVPCVALGAAGFVAMLLFYGVVTGVGAAG